MSFLRAHVALSAYRAQVFEIGATSALLCDNMATLECERGYIIGIAYGTFRLSYRVAYIGVPYSGAKRGRDIRLPSFF
jgi:hypothetical protein